MNIRVLGRLAGPAVHAVRWRPLLAGAVLGLAVPLIPEALIGRLTDAHLTTLTRIAATCVALGAAFLLDDPAGRSTVTVPTPRLARNLIRVAVAGPVIALCWAVTLVLVKSTGRPAATVHLPVAGLTLEAATLLAAALALSAVAQRRSADGNTSVVAAPAVLLCSAVAWFLPHPVELIRPPADPNWTASHHHWAAVLAAALAVFLWAGHERVTGPGQVRMIGLVRAAIRPSGWRTSARTNPDEASAGQATTPDDGSGSR